MFFSAIALVLILGSSVSSPKSKSANGDNAECTIMEVDKEKTICKDEPKGEVVEVLYFHGKQRCDTCRTIETLTREVINNKFAKELKNGKLQMSIVDISTREGELIADRYNVSWSSLFVNKWVDGKEEIDDITNLSFSMAKEHPEMFKIQIEAKLAMLLKHNHRILPLNKTYLG